MDRRKSLKALAIGTIASGVLLEACKDDKQAKTTTPSATTGDGSNIDRMKEEVEHYKEVVSKTFFTQHEMATITILADIIIPRDEVSGSASDAKVPEWIEFIVKDMPQHQTPMRGGLRWLDLQCLNRFEKTFVDCDEKQRLQVVDDIAWPAKAKPQFAQGVAFFNLMRNLTASGFYTTEIGVKDVGYSGNAPNQWNGVPEDVLKQYGVAYTEKEMNECVKY
ncbi:gluconate 2-dehydrogenase subunit 3 family protein [Pseudoflavitalea rhizosphaerae]|uniref:gluconate 2-dehydrogenase subunit 3 family protein n=1 Tax=Pseudoflavitalea rhizosphaerae TaxID=1884793 RepID=UPI000F8F5ED5|nr:gluconate 2-dehydrogenase subunit 3 family protein [Pseudoflavitalea rhizosphaerae]